MHVPGQYSCVSTHATEPFLHVQQLPPDENCTPFGYVTPSTEQLALHIEGSAFLHVQLPSTVQVHCWQLSFRTTTSPSVWHAVGHWRTSRLQVPLASLTQLFVQPATEPSAHWWVPQSSFAPQSASWHGFGQMFFVQTTLTPSQLQVLHPSVEGKVLPMLYDLPS